MLDLTRGEEKADPDKEGQIAREAGQADHEVGQIAREVGQIAREVAQIAREVAQAASKAGSEEHERVGILASMLFRGGWSERDRSAGQKSINCECIRYMINRI